MTFKDAIAELAQKLGVEIDGEGDACALMAKAKDGTSVTVWMQGYDERGVVLTGADLGAPPPERLERLYRAMLEGNDLFRDTGGATLSIDNKVKFNRDDDYVKDDDKIELIEKHYDFEENDSSEKGDVKIKNKDLELNEEQRKYVAKLNFNTLVEALLLRYGENFNFTREDCEDVLHRVEDWEEQLSKCDTEYKGPSLRELNDDLRGFLLDNQGLIQPRIDELIAERKKA